MEVTGQIGWAGVRRCTRALDLGCFALLGAPLWLLFSAVADGTARMVFAVVAGAMMLWALSAFLWAQRVYRDAASLTMSPDGLRIRRRGRLLVTTWTDVWGSRVDLAGGALELNVGRVVVKLRPHAYANADEVRAALRRWCSVYTLTESDETVLALGPKQRREAARARRRAPKTRLPQSTPVASVGYRDPVAPRMSEPERALRPWRRKVWLALGGTLVVGIVSAACVAKAEELAMPWLFPLGFVGGVVVFLLLSLLIRFGGVLRELSRRVEYLGQRLKQRATGVWDSDDGTRRWRMAAEDRGDAWRGPHLHLEALDRDGTTRASYVEPHDLLVQTPPSPRQAWIASVREPEWRATCFEGPPWKIRRTYGAPARLLLCDTSEGFVLTRFDLELRYAGDTWHASRADADRQIARELAVTVRWSELTEPPRGYAFLASA